MNTSSTINKIAIDLVKAQKEIGAAKKGSVNPFFKSTYADIGSVMEACKEALNNNNIMVLQPVGHDEQGDYVETVLLHNTGEFISDKMRLLPMTDAQKQGSAITYARRYSLQSMVFIPSEDDDANTAVKSHTATHTATHTGKDEITIDVSDKCPVCGATKTASGKTFHRPDCPNK